MKRTVVILLVAFSAGIVCAERMDDIGGTVLPRSENLLAGDNAALPKRRVLQN